MTDEPEIITAGGLIPVVDPAPDRPGTDVITARSYRHPAMDGRVVVRLVPAALGTAEDLATEFLGLTPAAEPEPVGIGRRHALGFPAWALVHDPGNGRHALAMVKDMERLARLAASKPGNARDGYEDLARRLEGGAPHFLPTFWEQAGRAYLAAGNLRQAGECFERARVAERTHAIEIDEQRLIEVHLEFALAGALPVKSVSRYAKDLTERLPADQAYETYRSIVLQRVAGGLPPHAGLAAELKRLARAAKLDADAEAEEVIGELLASPVVVRAVPGFWRGYRPALVRRARRDPSIRGRLLALLPDPPGWDSDMTDEWLELLEDTGASAGLTGPVEPGAAPEGGPAGWLARLVASRAGRWYGASRSAPLLALVERMAPALRAAARPVDVFGGPHARLDLDLVDLCLSLDIPPANAGEHYRLDLDGWLADEAPGRRSLASLAADARFRAALSSAVGAYLNERGPMDRGRVRHPRLGNVIQFAGLRTALTAWISGMADLLSSPTVLGLDETLGRLTALWTADGAALAPDAVRRLVATDVGDVLRRTLRAGLFAEYGWPAFDQAELSNTVWVCFGRSWPHLIVVTKDRARVLGPDGIVLDHGRQGTGWSGQHRYLDPTSVYVDGDLLVLWREYPNAAAYWASRPTEVFEPAEAERNFVRADPLPLPGGGSTTGWRPVRAGDRALPAVNPVASDGVNFWRLELPAWVGGVWRQGWWREYDPATGASGRDSVPAFFAAGAGAGGDGGGADEGELVPGLCSLRPAPAEFAGSPLGWADGLVGWRVRDTPDGRRVGVGVDGRRVSVDNRKPLVGAIRFPGSDELYPVTAGVEYGNEANVTIRSADGAFPLARVPVGRDAPPFAWWHALRPRDPAGSLVLRGITADVAGGLLAAGQIGDAAGQHVEKERTAAVRSAVERLLPEVTDPRLHDSIVDAVRMAARCRDRLDALAALAPDASGEASTQLTAERDEEPATAAGGSAPSSDVDCGELNNALLGLVRDFRGGFGSYGITGDAGVVPAEVREVGARLAGGEPGRWPASKVDWPQLLTGLGGLALRAASPLAPEEWRPALAVLLASLADAGFADENDGDDAARVRAVEVASPPSGNMMVEGLYPGSVIDTAAGRAIVVGEPTRMYDNGSWYLHGWAVERASGDTGFGAVGDLHIRDELPPSGWRGADRIRKLLRLLDEHGPAPWRPESADDLVERTGLTRAEAILLLTGLVHVAKAEANFLTAQQRMLFDVSMANARTARDALRRLTFAERHALLNAAMPDDPEQLWRTGPDVARVAEVWNAFFGRRLPVPDEVLAEAMAVIPGDRGVEIVRGLIASKTCAWLHRPDEAFTDRLAAVAIALPWLAYRLPAGDPIRATLPAAYRTLRELLASPDLSVQLGGWRGSLEQFPALYAVPSGSPDYQYYWVRPARLSGPDDPALAIWPDDPDSNALRVLLSENLARLMDGITTDELPAGTWPQNPALSTPDLVAEVAGRHQLTADAAAYYLQLLALPDPTDRNVARWTGWPNARLAKARAALLAGELVIAGKRERAGRGVFLPGPWTPRRAPHLPVESWKHALYEENPANDGMTVIDRPVEELFRLAWRRICDGDGPRFKDLGELG